MGNKINVEMTENQLEFIISMIHVDNRFRKHLEEILKQHNNGVNNNE